MLYTGTGTNISYLRFLVDLTFTSLLLVVFLSPSSPSCPLISTGVFNLQVLFCAYFINKVKLTGRAIVTNEKNCNVVVSVMHHQRPKNSHPSAAFVPLSPPATPSDDCCGCRCFNAVLKRLLHYHQHHHHQHQ